MFNTFLGILETFKDHPLLALTIFIGGALLIIARYSEAGLLSSLKSLLRVLGYFFLVPHEFMRTCLKNFEDARNLQQPYVGTREYVLHKFNQLQFLSAFIIGLLILAAGLTGTLIALYPKVEIEAQQQLAKEISDTKTELAASKAKVAEISAPDFEKNITQKRKALENAYYDKQRGVDSYQSNMGYYGPIISEISSASDTDAFRDQETQKQRITAFFTDCPDGYNWNNMTVEKCQDMQSKVFILYQKKLDSLDAEQKYNEAVYEERNVPAALEAAKNREAQLKTDLENKEKIYADNAIMKGAWVMPHLKVALGIFLVMLLQFLACIWAYALLTYFISWIAHVMRGIERKF